MNHCIALRFLKTVFVITLFHCGGDDGVVKAPLDAGSRADAAADAGLDSDAGREPNELDDLGLGITVDIDTPTQIAILENTALDEVSGITASKRYRNLFWMHNDSGDDSFIFAVAADGRSLGQWAINTTSYDWEDISSAYINGKSYLLIADFGDNSRGRSDYQIHVVEEPDVLLSTDNNPPLTPAGTINYDYPEKSYDSESMTNDGESIYIVTKRTSSVAGYLTNELYKLPLSLGSGGNELSAEHMGTFPDRSSPTDPMTQETVDTGSIGQPTSVEIASDNEYAYLLNYEKIFRFYRGPNQTWSESFLTGGTLIHRHELTQAEALTVAPDGLVWFTTENPPTPLWALPAP